MSYNLLASLNALPDVHLSVVLLNEARLATELRGAGLEVMVFDESHLPLSSLIGKVRHHLKIISPDIVHAHRYKENLLAVLTTTGLKKRCLVATQHGMPEVHLKGATLTQSVKCRLNFFLMSHFFSRTIAVSSDICSQLVHQHGFPADKVSVIRNGVSVPSKVERDKGRGSVTIGSSGRFFPVKDYPLMVEIAKGVAAKENALFKLAGEGPCRPEIEGLVGQYRLQDSFQLLGHVDDMDSFYRGLDIYINTSVHEGIPMTILEAMARGIPVIAPDVGGISEIVDDGVQGFLIKGRDPSLFVKRCLQLIQDDELRASMSRAAREKVANVFSSEQMAANYYRLYQELLAS